MDVTPFKNFVIKSTFSYYLYQRHTYRYYPGTLPAKAENEGGEAYRAEWDEHSLSSETTVRYNFNVMVGIQNDKIVYVPFSRAIKMDKPIDKELINVLGVLSI